MVRRATPALILTSLILGIVPASGQFGHFGQQMLSTPPVVRASCLEIYNAGESTGNGNYTVDPDGAGAGAPASVYCNMTDGGWTLVMASTSTDRTSAAAAQAQTIDCTTIGAYCNVMSKAWTYSTIRHTWTGCAGARAEISLATYQGDAGACTNAADQLLISWSGSHNGMKVWNDCGGSCGGQTRFVGIYSGGPTLWTSSHFLVATTGLTASSGMCGVVNYSCATGYDNVWIK